MPIIHLFALDDFLRRHIFEVVLNRFSSVLDSTLALGLSLGVDVLAAIEIAILPFKEQGMKHRDKFILLCVVVVTVLLG